jgi:hypothetical protein
LYSVTITNSSGATMTTADGKQIGPNETWQSEANLGNTYAHSEEFGSISFRDLGDEHFPGDSGETWGVLISYNGAYMVGRYEGGGQLKVTFDKHLQAHLSGMRLRHVQQWPLIAMGEE